MQFNSNLIQSFLGQSKGAKATPSDTSNVLDVEKVGVSNEFLSLLGETKALAESGISPEEFIETLESEDLGLSGGEKKALANSFLSALEGEVEASPEIQKSDLKILNTKESVLENSDLSKIINNKPLNNFSNEKVTIDTLAKDKLSSKFLTTKVDAETEVSYKSADNNSIDIINPKITNGKLLTIKEHASKKLSPGSFQSSEDFVAQAKIASSNNEENVENKDRKSFFPNSNNKILAFNKEQNNINNNIFSGKNPFINGNDAKVSKLSHKNEIEADSLDNSEVVNQADSISTLLTQTQPKGSGNQNSFANNSNVKVLDFSNINTANSEQLIEKITNYITTSRLENQDSLELIVKHNSLGQMKVIASKGQLPDQINLEIVANSDKGHQFFKSNEVEMIKSLSNSGVKLNDVKISMGSDFNLQSSEKGDSQFNQGQGSQHSKSGGQHASSNQDQSRRDRREQMWNTYRERLGA